MCPLCREHGGNNACKHSKRTTLLTEINENYKGKVHKLWREKSPIIFHSFWSQWTKAASHISFFTKVINVDITAADGMFAMTDVE